GSRRADAIVLPPRSRQEGAETGRDVGRQVDHRVVPGQCLLAGRGVEQVEPRALTATGRYFVSSLDKLGNHSPAYHAGRASQEDSHLGPALPFIYSASPMDHQPGALRP